MIRVAHGTLLDDIISRQSTGVALVGFTLWQKSESVDNFCGDVIKPVRTVGNKYFDESKTQSSSHFNSLTIIVPCCWRWSMQVCAMICICVSDKFKANKSDVDNSFIDDDHSSRSSIRSWIWSTSNLDVSSGTFWINLLSNVDNTPEDLCKDILLLDQVFSHTADALKMTDKSSKKSHGNLDASGVNCQAIRQSTKSSTHKQNEGNANKIPSLSATNEECDDLKCLCTENNGAHSTGTCNTLHSCIKWSPILKCTEPIPIDGTFFWSANKIYPPGVSW